MPKEPFLINPVKRKRSKKKASTKRRKRNAWRGDSVEHRKASRKGWTKRKRAKSGYAKPKGATFPRHNPLEEVIVMGRNPRKRKHRTSRKRKNVARRNYAGAANPVRKTSRKRGRRRSYRSNPVELSLKKPQTLLMPIAVGIAAKFANDRLPSMVGMGTGFKKYIAQLAVAFGGQMLLKPVVGKANADVWALISIVNIGQGVLNEYIMPQIAPETKAGIGYYANPQISAYPSETEAEYTYSGMGAFPSEQNYGY